MRSSWRGLAILLCHMWKVTKKKLQLHIRWVRGHTGDVGHAIADELADLGTRLEAQDLWWKRVQPVGDWEEDGFQAKISNLQKRKFASSSHPVVRCGEEQIPLVGAVMNTIAHSALKWSSAKNKTLYLDSQYDTMIEIRRLCLER